MLDNADSLNAFLIAPRFQEAPIQHEIDVVLITHNHNNHLEVATIRWTKDRNKTLWALFVFEGSRRLLLERRYRLCKAF
ncbi:hypothetical protein C7N83_06760 [Neisseria iguanae]|uniref:Metallo-beta-lactamase domain-containing protein n=1 Tax=Neisseria iguanae TaxID=90242 RepID=A0A2P7U094_9NEIS|nr:hypothetical protein C7N83_06760 [Neisseria iguanae]